MGFIEKDRRIQGGCIILKNICAFNILFQEYSNGEQKYEKLL